VWLLVNPSSENLFLKVYSSYKTSAFIVDALESWRAAWEEGEQAAMARLQITMDNGPERSGKRTQFLQRMVAWCDAMGQPIYLLYSPPYHSKYTPIERDVGTSWHGPGTGRSWWMSRR
jgi:Rhodopirellula transposase DDE domain